METPCLADTADTISLSSDTPAEPVADIVFEMEDVLNEGLCLTDALVALVEGKRTLRVKPSTIYFLAYEVQDRIGRIHEDWKRLFVLTRRAA